MGIVAIAVGCKTSNSSSNMSGSDMSADGGMMSSDGGMSGMSMDGGMSGAMDSAKGSMASGMSGMADAGSTAMQNGMGSATTAADAAKTNMGNMADAGMTSMRDMGSSMADAGSSAMGSMGSSGSSSADAGTSAASLSDAQIAGVTAAAHKTEIDAAKLAKKHSKNAKVKAFANTMIKQHTSAMKEETTVAGKAGITPADSDQSSQITQSGSDTATKLQGLKGKDFDKAYVSAQVDAHTKVLDMLDNTLIPAAQNADLKAQLTKERSVVATHLEHAKKLQDSMGGAQ